MGEGGESVTRGTDDERWGGPKDPWRQLEPAWLLLYNSVCSPMMKELSKSTCPYRDRIVSFYRLYYRKTSKEKWLIIPYYNYRTLSGILNKCFVNHSKVIKLVKFLFWSFMSLLVFSYHPAVFHMALPTTGWCVFKEWKIILIFAKVKYN